MRVYITLINGMIDFGYNHLDTSGRHLFYSVEGDIIPLENVAHVDVMKYTGLLP